jgi:hypothetical protein
LVGKANKESMHMVQVAPYLVAAAAAEVCTTAFLFIGKILFEKRNYKLKIRK